MCERSIDGIENLRKGKIIKWDIYLSTSPLPKLQTIPTIYGPCMLKLSTEGKSLKALCILHIVTLSGLPCARTHPVEHLRRAYLAAMLEQGFYLLVECLRDVDPGIRCIGSRHIHLADRARFQTLCSRLLPPHIRTLCLRSPTWPPFLHTRTRHRRGEQTPPSPA